MPATSYTMFTPDNPSVTFDVACSHPACISGSFASAMPAAAPLGRLSEWCVCAQPTVKSACSPLPVAVEPVRRSDKKGHVPKIAG